MLFTIASLTLAAAVTSPASTPSPSGRAVTTLEKDADRAAAVKAELVLASAIVNREATPARDTLHAGETLFAFTPITGPGGGYVEHVWTCDGKEVARHYLPVGQSRRWRTWSKHTLHAGQYRLVVLADSGAKLQEASFAVLAANSDDGEHAPLD